MAAVRQRAMAAALATLPSDVAARNSPSRTPTFERWHSSPTSYAGIALSDSKRNLIYSRLSRRLRVLSLSSFRDYRDYLDANPGRGRELHQRDLSTNHTKFFREVHHFEHFRDARRGALLRQAAARRPRARLRIWSAGCSTGEEPYTIAVVLKREIGDFARARRSNSRHRYRHRCAGEAPRAGESVELARRGAEDVLRNFFEPAGDDGRERTCGSDDVRSLIAFRRLNLMEAWPFNGLFRRHLLPQRHDLFRRSDQGKLVERFTQQLEPGGWLYIGHSESLVGRASGTAARRPHDVPERCHDRRRGSSQRPSGSLGRQRRRRLRRPALFTILPAASWMVKVFPGEFYVTNKPDEVLRDRARIVRLGLHSRSFGRHRRHESFHAAARTSRALGRRSALDALRQFRDGKAHQRADQGRVRARAHGDQGVRRRQRDRHDHRHRQRQFGEFVLRYLRSRGLALRGAGSRRNVAAAHPLLSGGPGGWFAGFSAPNDRYAVNREEHDYEKRLLKQQPAGKSICLGTSNDITEAAPVRVLIVDDSAVMRQLLATLLVGGSGNRGRRHRRRSAYRARTDQGAQSRRRHARRRDAAHGRADIPAQDHDAAADAGGDDLDADAARRRDHARGSRSWRRRFHRQTDRGRLAEAWRTRPPRFRRRSRRRPARASARRAPAPAPSAPRPQRARRRSTGKIVFVGASTGGVEALKTLLLGLPVDCPPILITQHMPPRFTTGFAERLNRQCPMAVSEAAHDAADRARPRLHRAGLASPRDRAARQPHVCRLSDGPTVSGHRPSVDVLFRSAARV